MTTDERLAEIRERMAESDDETYSYTVIHADHAQAIEDVRTLLDAIDDRDAVIAETLRRIAFENEGDKHVDVAQAVMDYVDEMCKQERKQIVTWLRGRADGYEALTGRSADQLREAADAIARGEGGA